LPGEAPGSKSLRFCFSQEQRLKNGWEFERARREGSRLVKGCLILNWRPCEGQSQPRLGVITSRKIGNAVARSRARRLLREAFRAHQHQISPEADLVLVARNSIADREYKDVVRDFVSALKQARLWIEARARVE
jgi:ribonuclease P protein component